MVQEQQQETKTALALELAKQTVQFGAIHNLQATWAASLALPWGLAAAGAAATRTLVDAGDVAGSGRATALMVKLGMTNLVRDIVVKLSRQDRGDVVAQITMALLEQGEFLVVSEINNALIAGGYMGESADIAGVLGSRVTKSFFSSLKEAGANLLPNLWPDHSQSPATSSAAESTHGLDDMAIDSKQGMLQDREAGI